MRLRIRVLLKLVALVAFSIKLNAQQLPQYSNYMLNNYIMNPAVGGADPYYMAVSTNRYQWTGITDAPRTYVLSVNGPTKSLNVGLGGTVFTDVAGPTRMTGFTFSYAYHLKLTAKVKLSFGLAGGLTQYIIDGSQIQLKDPSDLVITNGVQSLITPDFSFGFHLYSVKKTWWIGASVPQVTQNQIQFYNIKTASSSRLDRHYFVTAGYKIYITEHIKMEPSVCLQYISPAPMEIDLGLRLIYKNKFWLGGMYRTQEDATFSILTGYVASNDLVFMYSYDFTTSYLGNYSGGTHEILIGIKFNKVKEKNAAIQ